MRYPHTNQFDIDSKTTLDVRFRPHVEHSYGDNLECTLTLYDSTRTCKIFCKYIHVNEQKFGIRMTITESSGLIDSLTDHHGNDTNRIGDDIYPNKASDSVK